ncbi:GTP diphosphokinase [Rickettsiella grylli]|uniref:GTP pyrophosphokinase n=1 Tax=Rickettsiella grylli TaxID=59196 RepID=A8PP33_9COXI|nr:GTP diphosphokinase [Rickettsiella grylli]EDP46183.1 GTP pyrophosphokinase (ATP:GTP 3'-pyrophosphotransferase)(ppGpp synthetase I) ((P)ppGpp synthetase) [Rickettsiella grylli]
MVKLKNSLYLNNDGSINLEIWLHHAAMQRSQEDFKLIRQASVLSQIVGETKTTPTHVSCLQQGLTMAEILLNLHLDKETIAASLIYSCVNYAELCLDTVREHLGPNVAKIIEGAKQMNAIRIASPAANLHQTQLENIRKMLLAMVKDMRVVLIKLAERTATMRTLDMLDTKTSQAYARETLDIYASLANRLGVGQLQWELEDLSLHYLEPTVYTQIAQLLKERLIDRESYIQIILNQLRKTLDNAQLHNFKAYGRVKHIYSIYKKMQQKKLKFEELYDLNAIRILVSTVRDCYHVLSIIHNLWSPIAGQFDDYISTPKPNGYRSIHTAVIGPHKKVLEIQIRTQQMHQESEHGLAAHWQYKETAQQQKESYHTKIAWLRQVLAWQKEWVKRGKAIVPGLTTVLDDRVYVFTPNGDILDLPKGSTPLDFAYHIHSELGHRCRGAKINGAIVPLTYSLKIGDQIEILTSKQESPSLDWLNPNLGYLYTARAKAKAHHWFKNQDYEKHLLHGEELFNKEIQRLGLTHIDSEKLTCKLHFKTKKDMFAALGSGDLRLAQLLNAIQSQEKQLASHLEQPEILLGKPRSSLPEGISIAGVTDLLTQTAGCCKPVPGDPIRGFITQSRGIVLHRDDCMHLLNLEPEKQNRLVDAEWGQEASQVYPVNICVEAYNRPGLLRDVSTLIANEKLNLIALTLASDKPDPKASIKLTIEIPNLLSLSKVLDRIKQVPNVIDVRRQVIS